MTVNSAGVIQTDPRSYQTDRRGNIKPFTWSYSKLKNFENCQRKMMHVDLVRDFAEDESDSLTDGNVTHKALADGISKGTPLPMGYGHLQKWVALGQGMKRQGAKVSVEQKLALNNTFASAGYFADDAWFRGVVDLAAVYPDGTALALDWKTGKRLQDPPQLALMAACILASMPAVHTVRAAFVWLKHPNSALEPQVYTRESLVQFWAGMIPRVHKLEDAWNTGTFHMIPSGLCRLYCPVKSCPHQGK